MKTWTSPRTALACCVLALFAPACSSSSAEPPAGDETEAPTTEGATESSDTENADTENPDTEGVDTEGPGSETEGPDTDTEGEPPLPNDCSCYDAAVDVELGFEESCLSFEEALPGCSTDAPPCEPIAKGGADSGGDPEVGPAGAVVCLAEELAAGHEVPFEIGAVWFNGDESVRYVPLQDGRYVGFKCGFLDNPPAYQSVSTYALAEPTYFAGCLKDNPDDEVALLECVEAGLLDATESMPACESS